MGRKNWQLYETIDKPIIIVRYFKQISVFGRSGRQSEDTEIPQSS